MRISTNSPYYRFAELLHVTEYNASIFHTNYHGRFMHRGRERKTGYVLRIIDHNGKEHISIHKTIKDAKQKLIAFCESQKSE